MTESCEELPERDAVDMMRVAKTSGRFGIARKVQPVDARPAEPGEVIVTMIAGQGKETQSRTAVAGDMVVRSRNRETGNEMYLVSPKTFAERYEGPLGEADAAGWQAFRPKGREVQFFIVEAAEGAFTFKAPWGEPMVACPGDAIVCDPDDPTDTYRIAAAAFASTYEVTRTPVDS